VHDLRRLSTRGKEHPAGEGKNEKRDAELQDRPHDTLRADERLCFPQDTGTAGADCHEIVINRSEEFRTNASARTQAHQHLGTIDQRENHELLENSAQSAHQQ
jgi:hypothetical protein